jgi:hypothetical protein
MPVACSNRRSQACLRRGAPPQCAVGGVSNSSPATVAAMSRRASATTCAPLIQMTVAEIDEQRRQEEAERVNRLYDLPMSDVDGPRFDEPVMDRFTADIPDDLAGNLTEGEGEQIGQALVAAALGLTTAAVRDGRPHPSRL